jgi:hypothetical protein
MADGRPQALAMLFGGGLPARKTNLITITRTLSASAAQATSVKQCIIMMSFALC